MIRETALIKTDNSFTIHCGEETYVFGDFWDNENARDKSIKTISFYRISSHLNEYHMVSIAGLEELDISVKKNQKLAMTKLIKFFNINKKLFFGTDYLKAYPWSISINIDLTNNTFNYEDSLPYLAKLEKLLKLKQLSA